MEQPKQIISPISAYNNLILSIGEELSEIFDIDMYKENQVIFDTNSVILFGFIKLTYKEDSVKAYFKQPLCNQTIKIYKAILESFDDISNVVFKYCFLSKSILENFDSSISYSYIKAILDDVKNNKYQTKKYFIPFTNKIAHDVKDDITLNNLYKKYSYILCFKKLRNKIQYNVVRVVSSDLDESKCIENIRFLEQEIVIQGNINFNDLEQFLQNLMVYGNFPDTARITVGE